MAMALEHAEVVPPVTDAAGGPLLHEIGQSFYLIALMASVVGVFAGVGLLAARLFG